MDTAKRKRLEADGWKFGTVAEFLEMTPEEAELLELRHTVRMRVREARLAQGITQGELAKRLKTSQPRIVALEGTATDVGLELGFRALFALGVKSSDVHIKGLSGTAPRKSRGAHKMPRQVKRVATAV